MSWTVAHKIDGVGGTIAKLVSDGCRVEIRGTDASVDALIADLKAPEVETPSPSPHPNATGFYVTFASPKGIDATHVELTAGLRSMRDVAAIADALSVKLQTPATVLSWVALPKEPAVILAKDVPAKLKALSGVR